MRTLLSLLCLCFVASTATAQLKLNSEDVLTDLPVRFRFAQEDERWGRSARMYADENRVMLTLGGRPDSLSIVGFMGMLVPNEAKPKYVELGRVLLERVLPDVSEAKEWYEGWASKLGAGEQTDVHRVFDGVEVGLSYWPEVEKISILFLNQGDRLEH